MTPFDIFLFLKEALRILLLVIYYVLDFMNTYLLVFYYTTLPFCMRVFRPNESLIETLKKIFKVSKASVRVEAATARAAPGCACAADVCSLTELPQ